MNERVSRWQRSCGLRFSRNGGALLGAGESLGPDCGFSGLKFAHDCSACIILQVPVAYFRELRFEFAQRFITFYLAS